MLHNLVADDSSSAGGCRELVVSAKATHTTPSGVVLHAAQANSTYGMAHTGSIVWDASRALADYIDVVYGAAPDRMQGLRVLELGAGVSAFPSQVCANLGAQVTATDYEQIDLLEQNIQKLSSSTKCSSCVQQLDWSSLAALEPLVGHFDVVLCADVLYEQTWKDLLRFLLAWVQRDPRLVIFMCNTNRKAVHLFHRRLVATLPAGWSVERIASVVLDNTHVLWRIATCTAD